MLAELPRSLCAPSVFLTFPDPFPEANTETLPFCHRVLKGGDFRFLDSYQVGVEGFQRGDADVLKAFRISSWGTASRNPQLWIQGEKEQETRGKGSLQLEVRWFSSISPCPEVRLGGADHVSAPVLLSKPNSGCSPGSTNKAASVQALPGILWPAPGENRLPLCTQGGSAN